MRHATTLGTFRTFARIEESMIRAAMPRTSAKDALPLPLFAAPMPIEIAAQRLGSRLVRPLTFTIGEVIR